MTLTDKTIRAAKNAQKSVRLFDGGGLYIEIAPKGGKWWRLKYRFAGKEKRLSLGVYPHVALKQARERRRLRKRAVEKVHDSVIEPGAAVPLRPSHVADSTLPGIRIAVAPGARAAGTYLAHPKSTTGRGLRRHRQGVSVTKTTNLGRSGNLHL